MGLLSIQSIKMTEEDIVNLTAVTNRLSYLLNTKPNPLNPTWRKLVKMQIETIAAYLTEDEIKKLFKLP
jgi:hypothetical protein